jgi:TonB family protein
MVTTLPPEPVPEPVQEPAPGLVQEPEKGAAREEELKPLPELHPPRPVAQQPKPLPRPRQRSKEVARNAAPPAAPKPRPEAEEPPAASPPAPQPAAGQPPAAASEQREASISGSAAQPLPPAASNGGNEIRRDIASLISCHPDYPRKAMQHSITGEFVVHMRIAPSGAVVDVKIISGGPREVFERDIKRSLSKCRFSPTQAGFIAEVPLIFRLVE